MKYFDIKPVCPNWRDHRQMRRFMRSLESRGYINNERAVLVVEDKNDPCKSRILVEEFPQVSVSIHAVDNATPRLQAALMELAIAGYEFGMQKYKAKAS